MVHERNPQAKDIGAGPKPGGLKTSNNRVDKNGRRRPKAEACGLVRGRPISTSVILIRGRPISTSVILIRGRPISTSVILMAEHDDDGEDDDIRKNMAVRQIH